MGYAGEGAAAGERQIGQRRINSEGRKAKESNLVTESSKLAAPGAAVTGSFRTRVFDSGVYGVRISPLSKSLFGKTN